MKEGSIAKVEQITTISKQRIYDPKKNADVLSGIRFSDAAMDKINEKIKELYIFWLTAGIIYTIITLRDEVIHQQNCAYRALKKTVVIIKETSPCAGFLSLT